MDQSPALRAPMGGQRDKGVWETQAPAVGRGKHAGGSPRIRPAESTKRQGVSGGPIETTRPRAPGRQATAGRAPHRHPQNSIEPHHVPGPPPLHAGHSLRPHHTTPVASCPRQQPHSTPPPKPHRPHKYKDPPPSNSLLGLDRLSRRFGVVCRLGGRRGHHPAGPPNDAHRRSGPRLPAQGLTEVAAGAGTHRRDGEEGRCHDAWRRGEG